MPESAKHNKYSSFSKRESPRALYSVYLRSSVAVLSPKARRIIDNPHSKIVNVRKRYSSFSKRDSPRALYSVYLRSSVAVLSPKARTIIDNPRSKIVNVRKRKTPWIFFVLKARQPKSVIFSLSSQFSGSSKSKSANDN